MNDFLFNYSFRISSGQFENIENGGEYKNKPKTGDLPKNREVSCSPFHKYNKPFLNDRETRVTQLYSSTHLSGAPGPVPAASE